MSDQSSAMGAAAAPYTIEHGGKVYKARFINQKVKSEFVTWLKQEAMRALVLMKPEVDEETFDRLQERLTDQITAGKYAFHSDYCQSVMQKPGGAMKLTQLIFQCSEEELIDLLQHKGDEVKLIMDVVLKESFSDQPKKGVSQDPN